MAIEYSVEFDERNFAVFDPFHTPDDSQPLVVESSQFVGSNAILPQQYFNNNDEKVLFSGVGHRMTGRNPLIAPVLVGNPTAYAAPVKSREGFTVTPSALVGSSLVMVSALQARNNARIVFTGGIDMFSDQLIKSVTSNG